MMQSIRAVSQIFLSVQNSSKSLVLKTRPTQKCNSAKLSTSSARSTSNKDKKFTYEGILTPVYTPFSKDGENPVLENIPQYSNFLASKGIKGVLVGGTNGEGMVMSAAERASVIDAWVAAGHEDELHIQANVGGTNIKDALYLAKHAEISGVDSLLTLPELYYKPQSVATLVQYIKKIADAAPSLPILYYHIPSNTHVSSLNLIHVMTQASKEIPTFAGIKFTDGDMITGTALANLNPEKFAVFLGANEVMSGAYLLGFTCCTSATSNMFPELCLDILAAVKGGRIEEAKEKQQQLNRAIEAISQYGNRIACYKAATEMISGVPLGPTRFPIPTLDLRAKEKLRNALKELGKM